MAYPIPLDPATFATLQNTLTPEGVLSYMQRQAVEQQKQLADVTRQATQEAQSASQDYLKAAQGPPAEPDALAQFVPTLLGNVASTISQDPFYRQQAAQGIEEKRKDLRQKRADNLIALKNMWDEKAQLAAHAGDREAEINARTKAEQLTKATMLLMEGMREKGAMGLAQFEAKAAMDRAKLAAQTSKEVAGIRTTGGLTPGDEGDLDVLAERVESGQMKITDIPFRARIPVVRRIADRGGTIFPTKVRDTINGLSAARGVLAELRDLSRQVNKSESTLGRFKQGLESTAKGVMQSTAADALFDKTRDGLLATISRSTGEKGVLTDRDVYRARELLPTRYDKGSIAERKLQQFSDFLDNIERRTVRTYTTALPALAPAHADTGTPERVKVKRKSDGRTGYINADDPDLKSGLFVRVPDGQ